MNVTTYQNQGKARMAERDWSGVITSTAEGLRYYPYDPELLCLQGYALRKTGHSQESVDLITIAIPNDTRPVRYANRGYGFLAMGKAQDALNDADSALTLDASYATAYALKASALRMKGNLSLALETIEKAIAIEPHNAYYLHLEGGILDEMGNCAGADTAYRDSITINPDYDLPYPGLSNATVDLEKSAARCKDQGARTPPAKSVFPAAPVFIALIIFFVFVALGPQKLE